MTTESVAPTEEQLAALKYKTGDEVLCYEPDPKKKQVLYHARIIQVSSILEFNISVFFGGNFSC